MTDLKDDYEAAVTRLYDRHDVLAEKTSPLRESGPMQSIAARIATLAQQVTAAADLLEDARGRHRTAGEHRATCEAEYAQVAEALLHAINEHREGPPANVPERP